MLTITLFGTFHVTSEDTAITRFRSNKVRALLAFLLLESDRPLRREVLATLLWPDQTEHAARLNLRQALYRLRKALTEGGFPQAVQVTQNEVQFDRDVVWVDALTFETLMAACEAHPHTEIAQCPACIARLRDAADLYAGPFLAGLTLEDSEPFLDWLIPAQERFHHQALQALHGLAEHYLHNESYDLAQQYAQRQIALEPWRERAHQQLMGALALSGQRGLALAQYRRCAEILDVELGVEPDAITTDLAEKIRNGELSPSPRWIEGHRAVRPYALPLPLVPFFGRERELARLEGWLLAPHQRLITLVGPGGVGKTRLAVESSLAHTTHFAHGTCLVPLGTPDSSPSLFSAVATALDLSLHSQLPPEQQLMDFLAEKSLLLLMDGFETVLPSATQLVDLLAHAPGLKFLVTSRRRLGLEGEWVLPVEGFAVPDDTKREGQHSPAVRLFLQRAVQVRPTFAPEEADYRAISKICRLVEGSPLAIELAAGWVKALTCTAIEAELRQSAALLLDPSHDATMLPSLEPLLQQSWRLLAPTERYVFRKLSIFPGGFDRRAAEMVAEASLRDLLRLIDHSFLRRSEPDRYEAHELLRQYGLSRLSDVPHELADSHHRHATFYSTFLAERVTSLRGQHQKSALEEIWKEIENVRVAWEWSVSQMRFAELAQALDGLFHFYDIRSWFEEGEAQFRAARVALERWLAEREPRSHDPVQREPTRLLGKALAREGWFAFHRGDERHAQASLQRSRELLRTIDARSDLVFTLNYLATVIYYAGNYDEAQTLCEESRRVATDVEDHHGVAIANNISGQISFMLGEYERAAAYSEASLEIERAIGNRWSMAFSLYNLGNVAYAQGQYDVAQQQFEESLSIREEMEDFRGIATCYNRLGETAEALDEPEAAHARFEEALALFRSIGDRWGVVASRIKLGRVALRRARLEEAERHLHLALSQSATLHAQPITLDALAQWAGLLMQRGEWEDAGALLRFIQRHPATSQATQDDIAPLLAEVRGRLPGAPVAGAPPPSLERSLDEVVSRLLEMR